MVYGYMVGLLYCFLQPFNHFYTLFPYTSIPIIDSQAAFFSSPILHFSFCLAVL